jgi:hypothetical protein
MLLSIRALKTSRVLFFSRSSSEAEAMSRKVDSWWGCLVHRWFVRQLLATVSLGFILGLSGCLATERQAARQLDQTLCITRKASDLFASDPELSQQPITVDGFRNHMRLRGHVATADQGSRAERLLWTVPGVRSVENLLEIEESSQR